jgi:uncharacterized protein YaeQ
MALKSTIFKIELQVSDIDRVHYATYPLTIARHPSETDERMMLRVLAFALYATERLTFCKGLSDSDEPELWQTDLTGAIELWIELGAPDARRLQKATGRSAKVVVLAYGRNSDAWWRGVLSAFPRARDIEAYAIDAEACAELARLVERNMHLQCTIQEGMVWMSNAHATVALTPRRLLATP